MGCNSTTQTQEHVAQDTYFKQVALARAIKFAEPSAPKDESAQDQTGHASSTLRTSAPQSALSAVKVEPVYGLTRPGELIPKERRSSDISVERNPTPREHHDTSQGAQPTPTNRHPEDGKTTCRNQLQNNPRSGGGIPQPNQTSQQTLQHWRLCANTHHTLTGLIRCIGDLSPCFAVLIATTKGLLEPRRDRPKLRYSAIARMELPSRVAHGDKSPNHNTHLLPHQLPVRQFYVQHDHAFELTQRLLHRQLSLHGHPPRC